MMSMQAKETVSPSNKAGHPLRTYPVNSPRAKARLIVLALLADGRLDPLELNGLVKRGVFAELGIASEDFFQVLYDFCADSTRLPSGNGNYLMSPELLETIFDEVADTRERQKLVRLIFDVIRSDGHLAPSEAHLIWKALDSWRLRLDGEINLSRRAVTSGRRRLGRQEKSPCQPEIHQRKASREAAQILSVVRSA